MGKKSNDIARLFRSAREELINEILGILNEQEDEEMDLIESELRADIYIDESKESCEVIGISTDSEDDETYIHAKYVDEDGQEEYVDAPLGELDNEDLLEILSYMEDASDSE